LTIQKDGNGDLLPPVGHPELQYQPHSALVTCKEGERVLLRFANLGFREAAMTLAGINMRVVGRDATPMKGRDGTDTSYETDTLLMGAGESYDAIFTAPAYQGPGAYDTYVLYNRRYTQDDDTADGTQGQRTEVRVYPSSTALVQQHFNDAVTY
jgi:FtsP/CotA-like multicopper oxidase with cupredoxin domain